MKISQENNCYGFCEEEMAIMISNVDGYMSRKVLPCSLWQQVHLLQTQNYFWICQMLVIYKTHTTNTTCTHTSECIGLGLTDISFLSILWYILCWYVMIAWSYAGYFLWEYDHNCPKLCGKLNFEVSLLE